MKPHAAIPGVYMQSGNSEDFINQTLRGSHMFLAADMKKLTSWFDTIDHPMFELLTRSKMDNGCISFLDGYFNTKTLDFISWDKVDCPRLTDHYFDKSFCRELESMNETPLWDSLLKTQMADDARDTFEGLTGRLFYPVGEYDNWQVFPFLHGFADTGKGTTGELVTKMFPVGSVGTIGQETTFGLESLYNKRLVYIPELPEKISRIVDQSNWQSMISGEPVSVARKSKIAVSNQRWVVPMIAAGNHLPDYQDKSGSISRRMVVFPFDTLILDRNTELKEGVIGTELVRIMLRCIYKYRKTCNDHASKDFWKCIAPQSLREIQDETKESTNYLAHFLANGDNFYQILYREGAVTTFEQLNKAFSNHMRFHHKIEKKIGGDKHPIKAAGYTLVVENLCKTCHHKASLVSCGNHYNQKNRYKKMVIQNMDILTISS
jgi:hypothetical protein